MSNRRLLVDLAVFALAVLGHLVGPSLGGKIFEGPQSNKISLITLNQKLSDEEFKKPEDVTRLLSNSERKSKLDAVIGKLSVDEILELNKLELSHCTKEIGYDRRWTCNKMSSNPNLALYCESAHELLMQFCRGHLDDVFRRTIKSIKASDKKRMKTFGESVDKKLRGTDRSDDEILKAVNQVLSQKDSGSRRRLKGTCDAVSKAMEDVYYFERAPELRLPTRETLWWVSIDGYCKKASFLLK